MNLLAIDNFPDYFVSDCGRVYSKKSGELKLLRQEKNHSGYYMVTLRNMPVRKTILVHRLVCFAFNGPQTAYSVNHKNGDKVDNRAENLEWMSTGENIRHAWAAGLCDGHKGALHPRGKVSDALVLEIRALHKTGRTARSVAEQYGLSKPYITGIWNGTRRNKIND